MTTKKTVATDNPSGDPVYSTFYTHKDGVSTTQSGNVSDLEGTKTPRDTKYIAFFTQKGGDGKTTDAYQLAHYLGMTGHHVLVLDFDIQVSQYAALVGVERLERYNGTKDIHGNELSAQEISSAEARPALHDLFKGSDIANAVPDLLDLISPCAWYTRRQRKTSGLPWEIVELRLPENPTEVDMRDWITALESTTPVVPSIQERIEKKDSTRKTNKRKRPLIGSVSAVPARQREMIMFCRKPTPSLLSRPRDFLAEFHGLFDAVIFDLPPQEGPLHTSAFLCNTQSPDSQEDGSYAKRLAPQMPDVTTMHVVCPVTPNFLSIHGIPNTILGLKHYNGLKRGIRLELVGIIMNKDTYNGKGQSRYRQLALNSAINLGTRLFATECNLDTYAGWRGIPMSTHINTEEEPLPVWFTGAKDKLKENIAEIMAQIAGACGIANFPDVVPTTKGAM